MDIALVISSFSLLFWRGGNERLQSGAGDARPTVDVRIPNEIYEQIQTIATKPEAKLLRLRTSTPKFITAVATMNPDKYGQPYYHT